MPLCCAQCFEPLARQLKETGQSYKATRPQPLHASANQRQSMVTLHTGVAQLEPHTYTGSMHSPLLCWYCLQGHAVQNAMYASSLQRNTTTSLLASQGHSAHTTGQLQVQCSPHPRSCCCVQVNLRVLAFLHRHHTSHGSAANPQAQAAGCMLTTPQVPRTQQQHLA